MLDPQTPQWLRFLEKKFGWLEVPNIAVLIVTLQALGFVFVSMDPAWIARLALVPELVLKGEVWRLVTFLALPLSLSPIFVIFTLWFLYYILNLIESQWGSFKTTLYVLISLLVTIGYSFAFSIPVTQVSQFESTLFLAAAALFPEMEIYLFFFIPVKIKWLAWLTLAWLGWNLVGAPWIERGYILAIYSNYLVFFGPSVVSRGKQYLRRQRFKNQFRN